MQDNNARGTKTSAKDYQKEMMKDQPFNRHQAKTSVATDASDIGHGKKSSGKTLTDDAPRANTGLEKNPASFFPGKPSGFNSSQTGKTPKNR